MSNPYSQQGSNEKNKSQFTLVFSGSSKIIQSCPQPPSSTSTSGAYFGHQHLAYSPNHQFFITATDFGFRCITRADLYAAIHNYQPINITNSRFCDTSSGGIPPPKFINCFPAPLGKAPNGTSLGFSTPWVNIIPNPVDSKYALIVNIDASSYVFDVEENKTISRCRYKNAQNRAVMWHPSDKTKYLVLTPTYCHIRLSLIGHIGPRPKSSNHNSFQFPEEWGLIEPIAIHWTNPSFVLFSFQDSQNDYRFATIEGDISGGHMDFKLLPSKYQKPSSRFPRTCFDFKWKFQPNQTTLFVFANSYDSQLQCLEQSFVDGNIKIKSTLRTSLSNKSTLYPLGACFDDIIVPHATFDPKILSFQKGSQAIASPNLLVLCHTGEILRFRIVCLRSLEASFPPVLKTQPPKFPYPEDNNSSDSGSTGFKSGVESTQDENSSEWGGISSNSGNNNSVADSSTSAANDHPSNEWGSSEPSANVVEGGWGDDEINDDQNTEDQAIGWGQESTGTDAPVAESWVVEDSNSDQSNKWTVDENSGDENGWSAAAADEPTGSEWGSETKDSFTSNSTDETSQGWKVSDVEKSSNDAIQGETSSGENELDSWSQAVNDDDTLPNDNSTSWGDENTNTDVSVQVETQPLSEEINPSAPEKEAAKPEILVDDSFVPLDPMAITPAPKPIPLDPIQEKLFQLQFKQRQDDIPKSIVQLDQQISAKIFSLVSSFSDFTGQIRNARLDLEKRTDEFLDQSSDRFCVSSFSKFAFQVSSVETSFKPLAQDSISSLNSSFPHATKALPKKSIQNLGAEYSSSVQQFGNQFTLSLKHLNTQLNQLAQVWENQDRAGQEFFLQKPLDPATADHKLRIFSMAQAVDTALSDVQFHLATDRNLPMTSRAILNQLSPILAKEKEILRLASLPTSKSNSTSISSSVSYVPPKSLSNLKSLDQVIQSSQTFSATESLLVENFLPRNQMIHLSTDNQKTILPVASPANSVPKLRDDSKPTSPRMKNSFHSGRFSSLTPPLRASDDDSFTEPTTSWGISNTENEVIDTINDSWGVNKESLSLDPPNWNEEGGTPEKDTTSVPSDEELPADHQFDNFFGAADDEPSSNSPDLDDQFGEEFFSESDSPRIPDIEVKTLNENIEETLSGETQSSDKIQVDISDSNRQDAFSSNWDVSNETFPVTTDLSSQTQVDQSNSSNSSSIVDNPWDISSPFEPLNPEKSAQEDPFANSLDPWGSSSPKNETQDLSSESISGKTISNETQVPEFGLNALDTISSEESVHNFPSGEENAFSQSSDSKSHENESQEAKHQFDSFFENQNSSSVEIAGDDNFGEDFFSDSDDSKDTEANSDEIPTATSLDQSPNKSLLGLDINSSTPSKITLNKDDSLLNEEDPLLQNTKKTQVPSTPAKSSTNDDDDSWLNEEDPLLKNNKKTQVPSTPAKSSANNDDDSWLNEEDPLLKNNKKTQVPSTPAKSSTNDDDDSWLNEEDPLLKNNKKTQVPSTPAKSSANDDDDSWLNEEDPLLKNNKKTQVPSTPAKSSTNAKVPDVPPDPDPWSVTLSTTAEDSNAPNPWAIPESVIQSDNDDPWSSSVSTTGEDTTWASLPVNNNSDGITDSTSVSVDPWAISSTASEAIKDPWADPVSHSNSNQTQSSDDPWDVTTQLNNISDPQHTWASNSATDNSSNITESNSSQPNDDNVNMDDDPFSNANNASDWLSDM